MNALAACIKLHLGKMEGFMSGNLDLLMEFYNILDKDQKAMLLEKCPKEDELVRLHNVPGVKKNVALLKRS